MKNSKSKAQVIFAGHSKIYNLLNPQDHKQREYADKLISDKWDEIRKKNDYKNDYKKHFDNNLFVLGQQKKFKVDGIRFVPNDDKILKDFCDKYRVKSPINPKYSFPDILDVCYKLCGGNWCRLLEVIFISLLVDIWNGHILTPLAPVSRHHFANSEIGVQKSNDGEFVYSTLQGSWISKPNIPDVRDVAIYINLEAGETAIKNAAENIIDLYVEWYKNYKKENEVDENRKKVSRIKKRYHTNKVKPKQKVYNFYLVNKSKVKNISELKQLTIKSFPQYFNNKFKLSSDMKKLERWLKSVDPNIDI